MIRRMIHDHRWRSRDHVTKGLMETRQARTFEPLDMDMEELKDRTTTPTELRTSNHQKKSTLDEVNGHQSASGQVPGRVVVV